MMPAQYKMIYSKFFALLLAQGATRLIAKAKSVSHLILDRGCLSFLLW